MTDIVERLRDGLVGMRDQLEAADEIERLTARPADELLLEENKLMRAALLSQSDEIERLTTAVNMLLDGTALRDAEIERLKGLLKAKVTPGYELLVDQIGKRDAEIERLIVALEIIAGRRQCLDNLMGNVDVACAALDGGKP